MAQAVLKLCVGKKIFLKHQVNCNSVCGAIQDLSFHNICPADNPVKVLNEPLLLLVGRSFQPRSSVCATSTSLALMINVGMLWPRAEGTSVAYATWHILYSSIFS